MTDIELARRIDSTLLRADATASDIRRLCAEALHLRFCAVCIQPSWVTLAHSELAGTDVRIATVAGFPHGANLARIKAAEAAESARSGAHELDMVMNIGLAKMHDWNAVTEDIRWVVNAVAGFGAIVKVILECSLLSEDEKRLAASAAADAGAAFVKTSTGYGPGGATPEDVRLLAAAVAGRCKVKAAGGIRDRETALVMIEAGADRIGTSSGPSIVAPPRVPAI
jgi:deoxyribose-phosphate aldolase